MSKGRTLEQIKLDAELAQLESLRDKALAQITALFAAEREAILTRIRAQSQNGPKRKGQAVFERTKPVWTRISPDHWWARDHGAAYLIKGQWWGMNSIDPAYPVEPVVGPFKTAKEAMKAYDVANP